MSEEENIEKETDDFKASLENYAKDSEAFYKLAINIPSEKRQRILTQYKAKYSEELPKLFEKYLSGKVLDIINGLYTDPVEYDADCLYRAIEGLGTDDDCLIEILASRPGWLIQKIKDKYFEKYGKTLLEDVQGDTSGDYKKCLECILKGERRENQKPVKEECKKIAEELKEIGVENWGKNTDIFYKYFCLPCSAELAAIAREYNKLTNKLITKEIEDEFSGDLKNLLLTLLYATISPSEYFATQIKKACKGLGTDNKTLMRVLISRDNIDIQLIKKYYKQLYQIELSDEIVDETSGDYQKVLLELVNKSGK